MPCAKAKLLHFFSSPLPLFPLFFLRFILGTGSLGFLDIPKSWNPSRAVPPHRAMPVPFALVCDLLDDCEQLYKAKKPNTKVITQWFTQNRTCIDSYDTDLAALLSTLLPEKRTDRVYCIKTPTLEKVIGKALMLGASRLVELGLYKRPDQRVDLAECVERILTATVGLLFQSILAVQKRKKKKQSSLFCSQILRLVNIIRLP